MNTISRKDLYDMLWLEGAMKTSKKLGLNGNSLQKICMEYDLPRPDIGYFAKYRHNKKTPRSPLPQHTENTIDLNKFLEEKKSTFHYRLTQRIRNIAEQHPREITVPIKLKNRHPHIQQLKNYFTSRKKYYKNDIESLINTHEGYIQVCVTWATLPRMLRIVETFIGLAESRGHLFDHNSEKTIITIKGESAEIKFMENSTITKVKNGQWCMNRIVPNGKLSIKMKLSWQTKVWTDAMTPLEDQLPKIMAYMEIKAEDLAQETLKKESEKTDRLQRLEWERQRQQRLQWDREKKALLFNDSQTWVQTSHLHAFVQYIKSQAVESKEVQHWVLWAESVVEEYNVLREGPKSYIQKYKSPHPYLK